MHGQRSGAGVPKRKSPYFILAMILFGSSLVVFLTASIWALRQYRKLQEEYLEGGTAHVIYISGAREKGTDTSRSLTFKDEEVISSLFDKADSFVFSKYVLPFGLMDQNDTLYYIESLGNAFFEHSGQTIKANEALMTNEVDEKKAVEIELQIPRIHIVDDNFISDEQESTDVNLSAVPFEKVPKWFDELSAGPDTFLVNNETFANIIESMFQTPWQEFKENSSGENPYKG